MASQISFGKSGHPVKYSGRIIGYIKDETFYTERKSDQKIRNTPERSGKSFGISDYVFRNIIAENCQTIKILYHVPDWKDRTTRTQKVYVSKVWQWQMKGSRGKLHKNYERQRFLTVNNMIEK